MGSVLAAASPSPAPAVAGSGQGVPGLVSVPPGFTMPSVSSVPPAAGSDQPTADAQASLPNPGSYDECHRKCKGLEMRRSLCISSFVFQLLHHNYAVVIVKPCCSPFFVSEVFPLQMEGVRLVVNKGLSNHFQVSHTVTLSTLGDSGYRFGATYVGSKQTGPAEVMLSLFSFFAFALTYY